MNLLKKIPLSPIGITVSLISLIIFIRSMALRNIFEIILSLGAMLFIIFIAIKGAVFIKRLSTIEPQWKAPFPLYAGFAEVPSAEVSSAEDWHVYCPLIELPFFYRLHFVLRGTFAPQGSKTFFRVFREAVFPRQSGTCSFNLSFHLGGIFKGEAFCRLRDVFGLFSFNSGLSNTQTLSVRSSPCDNIKLRIDPRSGKEDKKTKTTFDEERYYMREYAPGDRLRDINWKSSERIDTLITRISPDNQEKVSRLEIHLRNYGPESPSLLELWLLDRAKARLAWFIKTIREENSAFIFEIHTAEKSWELIEEEDIDAFLDELCAISFSKEGLTKIQGSPSSGHTPGGGGELYIFTTAADSFLSSFLLLNQEKNTSLFIVQNLENESCVKLKVSGILYQGLIPMSTKLFMQAKIAAKNTGKEKLFVDYAKLSL